MNMGLLGISEKMVGNSISSSIRFFNYVLTVGSYSIFHGFSFHSNAVIYAYNTKTIIDGLQRVEFETGYTESEFQTKVFFFLNNNLVFGKMLMHWTRPSIILLIARFTVYQSYNDYGTRANQLYLELIYKDC